MNLGDERAGGVDDAEAATGTVLADFGRNSVGAVDDAFTVGNFVFAIDENGTLATEFVHDKAVMDDFLAHIDGRTEGLGGDGNDVDGAHYSSAKAARL